ncbi:unnamed protein product [Meganyctiphanes norvegica]|uniref:C2H2-type domain-containing protein n=1 Tax=Meganyctiphanes norvegica TaxID=48144 RepID=A0AAV2PSA6_MEGNR
MDEKVASSPIQMEETISNVTPGTNFSAPNVSEKRKLSETEGENNDEDESPPKKQQVDTIDNDLTNSHPEGNETNTHPEGNETNTHPEGNETNTLPEGNEANKQPGDNEAKKQPDGNGEDDDSNLQQVAEDVCVEYDMPAFFGDDDDDDEDETPENPDNDKSNVYYSGQGFHEIVEPGATGTVPCKACNRPFDSYRGLLQHVTHRKLCKELYGSEIEDLKLAIKLDPSTKKSDPSSRHKELVECSGCREQFRSLLSHLSKKPQCQVGYDMTLLKAQAEAAQKEKMKQYYRAKNIKNKSFDYGDYRGGGDSSDTNMSNDPNEILKNIMNSTEQKKSTQEINDSNSKENEDIAAAVKQEDVNNDETSEVGDKDIYKLENGTEAALKEAYAEAAANSEDGSGLHPLFPIAGLLHTMQKMNDGSSPTNAQLTPQQIFLMNFMNRVKTAQAANALANTGGKIGDKKDEKPKLVPNPVSTPVLNPASTSQAQFPRNGGNFGRKVGRSGMFMCARCKTGFINKDTYETHLSKSDCSKPQPGTRYPIKKSSSSGVYVCSKCKQGFIGTEVFENHMKTHET